MTNDPYSQFPDLIIDRPIPYVLRITINNPAKKNALTDEMHIQLERIWSVIDRDESVRCTILTGAGDSFCSGVDVSSKSSPDVCDPLKNFCRDFRTGSGLVQALLNTRKPIVSAINGSAVGVGLALALLADIPIAAKNAKLFDGHVRIGVTAGDHAALIWPLLCGMAKAKYFLLTNDPMTGEMAERNNLVALAVDIEDLAARSISVAEKVANSAPTAVCMTKYVLNHWLRQNQAIFDLSAAFEMIGFQGAESNEAVAALIEKRQPNFEGDSLL